MSKPYVKNCPFCNDKPNVGFGYIACDCGLKLVAIGEQTGKYIAGRWNRLHIGQQDLLKKVVMQRKEIEALSKRVAV